MIIPVPYISQWQRGATRYRSDCGPTCVAMLLSWQNKLGPLTVDNLAGETAIASDDIGLPCSALVGLGARHGLSLHVNSRTSLADIRAELDGGRPVICLIAYRDISGKLDVNDNVPGSDGHFVLAVGYQGDMFYLNDPDWWGAGMNKGHNFNVSGLELDRAIADAFANRQCVFIRGTSTMTIDLNELNNLLAQAKTVSEGAAALEARLQADVTAMTPPSNPTPRKQVTTTGLRVHASASLSSLVKGVLTEGATVTVVDDITADGYAWAKLVDGPLAGGYIAETYLTDPK